MIDLGQAAVVIDAVSKRNGGGAGAHASQMMGKYVDWVLHRVRPLKLSTVRGSGLVLIESFQIHFKNRAWIFIRDCPGL